MDPRGAARAAFRAFADEAVAPEADRFDAEERLPRALIDALAARGWLAGAIPEELGGAGMSAVTLGSLHAEIGRACGSTRSLLTVASMVAAAITRSGSEAQRARWLPALARGEAIAAFALTEPGAGSDVEALATTAERDGDAWVLRGQKRWISFAQIADVFLVIARASGALGAFLVEAGAPGLGRVPVRGLLGVRASQLADLELDAVRVPLAARLGRDALPFSLAASTALDVGRYSVAWGAVGLAEGCLAASAHHARTRRQAGRALGEHQLVQRLLTGMITGTRAARLLCEEAGARRDAGDPRALVDTLVAKHFATTTASRVAADAVQIHGASGCARGAAVERHFRDAKVLEIIEGSTQLLEVQIARHAPEARDP